MQPFYSCTAARSSSSRIQARSSGRHTHHPQCGHFGNRSGDVSNSSGSFPKHASHCHCGTVSAMCFHLCPAGLAAAPLSWIRAGWALKEEGGSYPPGPPSDWFPLRRRTHGAGRQDAGHETDVLGLRYVQFEQDRDPLAATAEPLADLGQRPALFLELAHLGPALGGPGCSLLLVGVHGKNSVAHLSASCQALLWGLTSRTASAILGA